MAQAIETKSLGPTDKRGPKIKATAAGGSSILIDVPDNYHAGDIRAHALAARELARKLDWPKGEWAGGATRTGFCFVAITGDGFTI